MGPRQIEGLPRTRANNAHNAGRLRSAVQHVRNTNPMTKAAAQSVTGSASNPVSRTWLSVVAEEDGREGPPKPLDVLLVGPASVMDEALVVLRPGQCPDRLGCPVLRNAVS
jgi:hypothetical protein